MRVAVLGRTQFLYDAALEVERRGHSIVLVGTCTASPEYSRTEKDFESLAQRLGVPFFCDSLLHRPEHVRSIESAAPDVAISVNWLTLVNAGVRGMFQHGIINAHFGDLPRYRGNAAPNWAIIAGEDRVVVTLHEMVDELDAGDILLQRTLELTDSTYVADVYSFATTAIPSMFGEVIDAIDAGTVQRRPQSADPAQSLRCFPRLPADGMLDWSRPAEELARLVRASAEPFAGAFTHLDHRLVRVWRAHASRLPYPYLGVAGHVAESRRASGEVAVLTGDGVLVLEVVQPEGGDRCPAAVLLNSTRLRLGRGVQDPGAPPPVSSPVARQPSSAEEQ